MMKLFKEGRLERVHGIWGTHEDAGDWDTLTHHLAVPYRLFELYEMFPTVFGQIRLPLPENEAASTIPHILADALWMLDGFKRLQLPEGGVRGGYGDPWGEGENFQNVTSWTSKCILVYAANPRTSCFYAACAARAARVLAPIAPQRTAEYRESALRAWQWAEKKMNDPAAVKEMISHYGPKATRLPWGFRTTRARAAMELYVLTRDPHFGDELKKDFIMLIGESDLLFAYARSPRDLLMRRGSGRPWRCSLPGPTRKSSTASRTGSRSSPGGRCRGPVNSGNSAQSWFSTPAPAAVSTWRTAAFLTKKPEYWPPW